MTHAELRLLSNIEIIHFRACPQSLAGSPRLYPSSPLASSPLSGHPSRVVSRTFQGKKKKKKGTEHAHTISETANPGLTADQEELWKVLSADTCLKGRQRVIVDLLWNLRKVP